MIKVLYTAEDIESMVLSIADAISNNIVPDSVPVLLCILRGAYVFTADLSRRLFDTFYITTEISFAQVSSYVGTESNFTQLLLKPDVPLIGRDVIIVEDIVDSGRTIDAIKQELIKYTPKSIKTASLCVRDSAQCDYPGFILTDNSFIVGYGLDYNEDFRYLPYLCTII